MSIHPSRWPGPKSLTLVLGLSLATDVALANVVGVDAQNFNATTSGLDFVTVQSSQTLAPGVFNLGLFANYARNPLPAVITADGGGGQLRDSVTGGDLNFGLGLMSRWDFGLSLPQILAQTVESNSERIQFSQNGNTEIRLNTKVRLLGEATGGIAVVGTVSLNRIADNPYAGSGAGPTKTLELVGDQTFGPVRAALNLGYRWRQGGQQIAGDPIEPFKNQTIYSAAANYLMTSLNTKVIVEVFGSSPVKSVDAQTDRSQSSAEALLGLKHDVTDHVAVHVGGGTKLSDGVGSPDWRVYAGVNVTFGPLFGGGDEPVATSVPRRANAAGDAGGGPIPAKPPKEHSQETIVIGGVMFGFDSDREVLPGTKIVLKKLGDYLLAPPRFKALVIEGHTDSIGSDAYNQELSLRRASTIKRYLVEVLHFNAALITVVGYGATRPIADNGNYQGRQRNRRVEFQIER